MYQKYNELLRALAEEDADVSKFANRYPTTLACIVSGILKLCRVAEMPEGAEVFRGLSGLVLPPSFFERDEQGFAGGVEPGFMSTTTDAKVAVQYSGIHQGREATIFCLQLGKMSLGADVSWLSQFAGEKEMLFPPRTHLQIVGEPELKGGVSVITLRPTVFQNMRSIEQVQEERKVHLQQLASGFVWNVRNQAAMEKRRDDDELAARLDALQDKLIADHCKQDPEWYNDNAKYKGAFLNLMRDAEEDGKAVLDRNSSVSLALAKTLTQDQGAEQAAVAPSAPPVSENRTQHEPSSEVSAIHSRFYQDLAFKGNRANFGTDTIFDEGIDGRIGPMDVQYIRDMHNEHNEAEGAHDWFTTSITGLKTTAAREWGFVVGIEGLDKSSWTFVIARAVPHVQDGMMVPGRNAKSLAELLDTEEARQGDEGERLADSPAEMVALRLYTGVYCLRV